MNKWLIFGAAPVFLTIAWSFPVMLSFAHLILLSICIFLGVFSLTIWGHFALSTPHQTPLFLLDTVEKEVRQLEDILKVRYFNIYLLTP